MLARLATAALRRPLGGLAPRVRASSTGKNLSYTERMEATGRPISPHLFGDAAPLGDLMAGQVGIYKFPTIAISSIMVRITGVVLSVGTLGTAAIAIVGGPEARRIDVGATARSADGTARR